MALDIVTRAEWGARKPRSTPARRDPAQARGVTVHHKGMAPYASGAASYPHSKCAAAVRADQDWHMDGNGWSDIAYSYLLCQHGTAYEGRGLNWAHFANGSINTGRTYLNPAQTGWYSLQAMIGSQDPTAALVATLAELTHFLRGKGVGDEVTPHSYFKVKPCPGVVLSRWAIEHNNKPVIAPPPPPAAAPVAVRQPVAGAVGPEGPFPLPAGHAFGRDDESDGNEVALWNGTENPAAKAHAMCIQREVGPAAGTADGHIGPKAETGIKAWQAARGLTEDGRVGARTWAAMVAA